MVWFFSTIVQPRRTIDVVFLVQAHVDQVAAAANALEDVLDVMRQRGDRLADGGKPLGLDLGVVKHGVLDRQAGLVADRDHQHQMVLRESACGPFLDRPDAIARRLGLDVGIEHAQRGMPSLNRDADRLADAGSRRSTARG